MEKQGHIAIDLGAESGRVVLGEVRAGRLWMQELHRFPHRPLPTPGGLCWDLTTLWRDILEGLRKAAPLAHSEVLHALTIGVDSWGVDWSVVSDRGTLVGLPRCYRDPEFADVAQQVRSQWGSSGDEEIYNATGIQLMPFNTLFQLLTEQTRDPARLRSGQLLFIPDLFHWLLTGKRTVERTNASTSQMLSTRTGEWAYDLLKQFPATLLPAELIEPGTIIGTVLARVLEETGLPAATRVIAPATHDTAAAIAAVPADSRQPWAYLSSGTWSLLGAELPKRVVTPASFRANFTNELGVAGTVRFLKNIAGLWLVQECRRCLELAGEKCDYPQLTQLAEAAAPLRTLIDASDGRFLAPHNMVHEIEAFARETGQPVPTSPGELVRCCLESLALEYRRTLATLSQLVGQQFEVVHLVGGGSKNKLLNQFAADAMGVRVLAGPVEATAIGNLLTQAMGAGVVKDLAELRQIVRDTFTPEVYEPRNADAWATAAQRYENLKEALHAK